MIELVARVRGVRVFHAAREIAHYFGCEGEHEERSGELIAFPIGDLHPRPDVVQACDIRPETAKASGAGVREKVESGVVLKAIVSGCGVFAALGFLALSALTNYLFASTLGRDPFEANVYGAVGVLAVLFNALCPFFLAWGREAGRPPLSQPRACGCYVSAIPHLGAGVCGGRIADRLRRHGRVTSKRSNR